MAEKRPRVTREIKTWLWIVGSVTLEWLTTEVLSALCSCVNRCHDWPYWASGCKPWRWMLKDISMHMPIWVGFDDMKMRWWQCNGSTAQMRREFTQGTYHGRRTSFLSTVISEGVQTRRPLHHAPQCFQLSWCRCLLTTDKMFKWTDVGIRELAADITLQIKLTKLGCNTTTNDQRLLPSVAMAHAQHCCDSTICI